MKKNQSCFVLRVYCVARVQSKLFYITRVSYKNQIARVDYYNVIIS